MRPARFALLSLVSVTLLGTAWLGCSSFSGQDTVGGQDASSASDGATIQPGDGATGSIEDGAADGQSALGNDSGALDIDTLPCNGGTKVFKDDMKDQGNWELVPPPASCPPSVDFRPVQGANFDCDSVNGAFQVLATKELIPVTRAVVAVQFKVLDDTDGGTVPRHVFMQLLGALGASATNLAFVYDQTTTKSVIVYGEGGAAVAQWNGVGSVTSHILRIFLPPVGAVQSVEPIALTLDGNSGTSVVLLQRNSGKLQIGPYLQAEGHAKDRFGAVRMWSCP